MTKQNRGILLLILGLIWGNPSFTEAQVADLNFQIWFQTTVQDSQFVQIVATKDWASGELVDYTSNSHFGVSRSSGNLPGWAIALQPNGAWTWNVGDGKNRLDYLPTAKRQRVNDGLMHYLALSLDTDQRAVWLYYDGELMAIYSLDELDEAILASNYWRNPELGNANINIKQMELRKGTLQPDSVKQAWLDQNPYRTKQFYPQLKRTTFNLMAWNIWHGGRRDGIVEGLDRTKAILSTNEADIICMQETYGSGPILADRLNMIYYYRSTNLSVMSRYPIIDTHRQYEPFRLGGVTLAMPNGQKMRVFSLWIHYLPSLTKIIPAATSEADILAEENKTRGTEIITALQPLVAETDSIPMVIAGDFNSPSHLDWTDATLDQHYNLKVPWPASTTMANHQFIDAYRYIHTDPVASPGKTWSPKFKDGWQDRIDYIYYGGPRLKCTDAKMLENWDPQWPSDHAAVWGKFSFEF